MWFKEKPCDLLPFFIFFALNVFCTCSRCFVFVQTLGDWMKEKSDLFVTNQRQSKQNLVISWHDFFPALSASCTCSLCFMIGSFSRLLVSFFFAKTLSSLFFSSGENVKEFFRRVAAITFEQAILGELESRGTRLTSPQIGTGGVLSKYSFTLYLLRNVW